MGIQLFFSIPPHQNCPHLTSVSHFLGESFHPWTVEHKAKRERQYTLLMGLWTLAWEKNPENIHQITFKFLNSFRRTKLCFLFIIDLPTGWCLGFFKRLWFIELDYKIWETSLWVTHIQLSGRASLPASLDSVSKVPRHMCRLHQAGNPKPLVVVKVGHGCGHCLPSVSGKILMAQPYQKAFVDNSYKMYF